MAEAEPDSPKPKSSQMKGWTSEGGAALVSLGKWGEVSSHGSSGEARF